eukprot:6195963-Pleurochrysis_carterae.AAC.2
MCILYSCVHQFKRAHRSSASRRRRARLPLSTARSASSNVLYIQKTNEYSWGCDLVVGIGNRQLSSLLYGAVGARGGWDWNPAYWIRGGDLQNFRPSASVTYSPIRHWESGDRTALLTRHSPFIH